MKTCCLFVAVSLALLGAAPAKAPVKKSLPSNLAAPGDWPSWRGHDRTGISKETGLLAAWPEGGPKLLWTASGMGEGFSTPSVVGNMIFLMGNREGKEFVLAFDGNKAGKEVWATALGPVRANGGGYPGPRSTPTVDGNRVFALGLSGDLVCLDAKTGRGVWTKNLVQEFGGNPGGWGYCESVLIDGTTLICTPGGKQATLMALQKSSGAPIWAASIGDQAGYSSIVKADLDGVKQYVQFTSSGVVGVDAKAGALLWRYNRPANGTANISTAVATSDSVFAASGYGTGGGLVHVHKSAAGFSADEAYFTKEMKNHHGGMILLDGFLYGADEGLLTCLDFKTGESQWRDRGTGKCSLVYADGMLYARSEKGKVSLVRATPERFELCGQFEQPDRSDQNAWPHPVIASGRLYLRDQDRLFCYDIRGTTSP